MAMRTSLGFTRSGWADFFQGDRHCRPDCIQQETISLKVTAAATHIAYWMIKAWKLLG
ncbi:hypothetical protein SLEP1_g12189 [Rubroshorea leprosula]|uniref:Uncharacterized protein n=1 Tax=Rubroshorea leprosula TaxID=152421 RepID=A0AAV5IKV2_9ROSI|nr:hypothetical protein SLEP1_g12189 [Rubroshorea leprosula]